MQHLALFELLFELVPLELALGALRHEGFQFLHVDAFVFKLFGFFLSDDNLRLLLLLVPALRHYYVKVHLRLVQAVLAQGRPSSVARVVGPRRKVKRVEASYGVLVFDHDNG